VLAWSMLASVGAHAAGVVLMALGRAGAPLLLETVSIEIVTVSPPPPHPRPVPLTPQRLVEPGYPRIAPAPVSARQPPALAPAPRLDTAPTPPLAAAEPLLAPSAPPPRLTGEARPPSPGVAFDPPAVPDLSRVIAGVRTPLAPPGVTGDLLSVPHTSWGAMAGASAAAGGTRRRGTMSAQAAGATGESGGATRADEGDGVGPATSGSGADIAARSSPAENGNGGATRFARPLGGYQTKPEYPESARRAGIQGVTRLRFEVLATGEVGRVLVDESAGSAELDRAAIEAVKRWRFEPARRDEQPVTAWVTLPVRFELRRP